MSILSTTPEEVNAVVKSWPPITDESLRRALNPPVEPSIVYVHEHLVANVFAPLDKDSPERTAWTDREEKQFQDYIADAKTSEDAAYDFLSKATKLDKAPEQPPLKVGDKYFRYEPDADLIKKPRFQVSGSKEGPWRTLLDPDTVSKDGTSFIDTGLTRISRDGERLLYYVSDFGRDAGTLRIMDVETGKDLPDALEFKVQQPPSLTWDGKGHDSFRYTHEYGPLLRHVVGEDFKKDTVVAAVKSGLVTPLNFGPSAYEWVNIKAGTDKNYGVAYWKKGETSASAVNLVAPRTFSFNPLIEQADGSVLAITTKDAPNGRLVSFRPDQPAPENWKTIIPESPTDILQSARISQGKFLTHYLHDAASALKVFDLAGQHLYDAPLPVQSLVSFRPSTTKDEESPYVSESGVFKMSITSFKDAGSSFTYDIAKNDFTLTKNAPLKTGLEDAIVERLYATSKDGTKIPMTVIRGADTKLDGTAAVKLYGYGAFGERMGPGYNPDMSHFVKAGGIYVQTNLRGGGEFGEAWHDLGRLDNKQNTFDDFIACAEHLVKENYTTPKRIVIEGGSAGGLLTAATVLQRPDLFGAVIADRPATDLIFIKSPRPTEFGDPARVKKDFNVAAAYSPVQNVKHGAKYPPQLIVTGDHDDRVDPGQPYRLAATLQAESDPSNVVLLHVEKGASHTTGKDPVRGLAQKFAFVEKALGPINQDNYKAKVAADKKAAGKKAVI